MSSRSTIAIEKYCCRKCAYRASSPNQSLRTTECMPSQPSTSPNERGSPERNITWTPSPAWSRPVMVSAKTNSQRSFTASNRMSSSTFRSISNSSSGGGSPSARNTSERSVRSSASLNSHRRRLRRSARICSRIPMRLAMSTVLPRMSTAVPPVRSPGEDLDDRDLVAQLAHPVRGRQARKARPRDEHFPAGCPWSSAGSSCCASRRLGEPKLCTR